MTPEFLSGLLQTCDQLRINARTDSTASVLVDLIDVVKQLAMETSKGEVCDGPSIAPEAPTAEAPKRGGALAGYRVRRDPVYGFYVARGATEYLRSDGKWYRTCSDEGFFPKELAAYKALARSEGAE